MIVDTGLRTRVAMWGVTRDVPTGDTGSGHGYITRSSKNRDQTVADPAGQKQGEGGSKFRIAETQ